LNRFLWIFNSYIGIIEAQNVANKLLKSYNKNLPDNSFVFGHNWECKFFYFVDNNTNNPEIYMCSEQNCEHNQKEYELVNYKMGNFTDWIINQTIGELIMCKSNEKEIKDTKNMLEEIRESIIWK